MAAKYDSQKQLLTLIRDVATEKSQGERRVVSLKKRITDLRSEFETVNGELEQEKRHIESYEQEIKGYEVELSMNDSSIQSLEARNSLIQDEISKVGSHSEALKNEEGALRDAFIRKMADLNATIRRFYEGVKCSTEESSNNTSYALTLVNKNEKHTETEVRNLLDDILAQATKEEQELAAEQGIHKELQRELFDLERKVAVMAALSKDTQELKELTGRALYRQYALLDTRQTAELEQKCASLSEELQKSSICPKCNRNNADTIE